MFGWFKKKVETNVILSDGRRFVRCVAKNNVCDLTWSTFNTCGTLKVRLLPDGTVTKNCDCWRTAECTKPYGQWRWSEETRFSDQWLEGFLTEFDIHCKTLFELTQQIALHGVSVGIWPNLATMHQLDYRVWTINCNVYHNPELFTCARIKVFTDDQGWHCVPQVLDKSGNVFVESWKK